MPTQKDSNFAVALEGLTIKSIEGLKVGSDEVIINTVEGRKFRLYHEQECCENVTIRTVEGDLDNYLNKVIDKTTEQIMPYPSSESATLTIFGIYYDSYSTIIIEWIGTSNGYYSESVSFVEMFD